MELWIRSQDRKRLYKATELFIEKDIYKDWCIETEIGHDYITKDVWYICVNQARLGKYFNEERALEVLNEIQNILKSKYILDTSSIKPDGDFYEENGVIFQNYDANAKIEELSTFVYQMPEK